MINYKTAFINNFGNYEKNLKIFLSSNTFSGAPGERGPFGPQGVQGFPGSPGSVGMSIILLHIKGNN